MRHNTYLSYDSDPYQSLGWIQFNGGNVFSPLAKFEVVTANTGIGLVHIRCTHNKKFLRLLTSTGFTISPEADEPVEDRLSWMSTLFQPILVDGDINRIRLALIRSNQVMYTIADQLTAPNRNPLRTWSERPISNNWELYDIVDLESLVMLPKHVAFKDGNDHYVTLAGGEGPGLKLVSAEKGDPKSWFEVSADALDGSAQIRSYLNKLFWRCNRADSVILADTPTPVVSTTPIARTTSFWPIKVDRNVIALRSFVNNAFCGRFGNDDSLFATHQTIAADSRLEMEELVLSRTIYNAHFDLANAVIYGETPVNMATANVSNNTSAENTVEFKFAYTESRSTTWTANHSWMVGVSVSVSFRIPFIGSTGIETSAEYSGAYEWGETLTSENTLETTYSVAVPPHTSVTVSLMATKGSCDVPFSYYQRDVLYNGKTEIYRKDDGLYTGINSYNFRYEVAETRTDSSKTDQPTIYREQKIPMPSDAAITQLLPTSVNKATQEQHLEGVALPLEETPQEQKVQLPLEETVDEVQKLSVT